MKIARSLIPAAWSVCLLVLVAVNVPTLAKAQTPHSCKLTPSIVHQGSPLGPSIIFTFAKACPTDSGTTYWRTLVYNYNNQAAPICQTSWAYLPPNTRTLSCPALPRGPGYQVKVVFQYYKGASSMMTHTELYTNP
jgi:hypothetical protein